MARTPGSSEQNETKRRKAIEIIKGGATQAEAAKQVRVILRTVQRWWKLYRDYGDEGLKSTKATGRPHRLSKKDSEKLGKILIKGAVVAGFPNELWTSKRVLAVIKTEFGVSYHANHLPRLLRSLGFSPQRPQREAAEKDHEQIKKWVRYTWTRIKKKARARKATIVFIDEAGILMAPVVKRTWAPAGETPKIIHKTRSHKKITAIGAIAVRYTGRRPRMMFRLLEGRNANSQVFVQFLNQLLQNIDGHIIVIWDRLVAHRSKIVNRWLEKNRRIETEFFPPYAPELNPVEYLWSYLKMNGLANLAATDLEQLYRESKSSLCDIRKQKNIIRAFIDHSPAIFFD